MEPTSMVFLHIDMDAYFAACEHARRDINEALIIVNTPSDDLSRGAVTTADYTAREAGIYAGMPVSQAQAAAEEHGIAVTALPSDMAYYKEISERLRIIIADHVVDMQAASIDEAYAYLDTDSYESAAETAQAIKAAIQDETDLTASIGVGPNKLIAKMASDERKPDGLTIISEPEVDDYLSGKPVDALHGIGPKTAARLDEDGIRTIDDLQEVPAQILIDRFGESRGTELYNKARGEGSTDLSKQERKAFSRITSLNTPTDQVSGLRPIIRELASAVHERVTEEDVSFQSVSILLFTSNGTRSRTRSLPAPTRDLETIYTIAEDLAEKFLKEHDTVIRRVGVRIGKLQSGQQARLTSF